MTVNTVIKLLLILLSSIYMLYSFKEHFTAIPINWRDTSMDNIIKSKDNESKVKKKYLDVAESGYNAGKYNIQYHESEELIETKNKGHYNYDYIKISNNNENEQVKRLRIQNKILYEDPIHYKYGITPYVPSYTDTILLTTLRPNKYNFSKIV